MPSSEGVSTSKDRLRVGVYFSFPAGGIGRYNAELLKALCAWEDLEFEYACLPNFKWADELACPVWPGLFGISHEVPVIRMARFLAGQWRNPVRALRHFKKWGAQVIHWTNVNHLSFPYWRGAQARSGLKMVISAHDVRRQVAVLNRRYEDRQLAAIYRTADALLVPVPLLDNRP